MTSNSYIFRVSDVLVHNCRSKGDHNDSDWMHLVVTINDQVQEPTGLFNIGDNIHAGDELHGPWDVGPYLISDQDKVIVTLMVENLSHTNTAQQIGEAIKVGTLIVAAFGGVASALSKATAAIKLNAILAGVIGTAGKSLVGSLASLIQTATARYLASHFSLTAESSLSAPRSPYQMSTPVGHRANVAMTLILTSPLWFYLWRPHLESHTSSSRA
jgi:hypothetical protein